MNYRRFLLIAVVSVGLGVPASASGQSAAGGHHSRAEITRDFGCIVVPPESGDRLVHSSYRQLSVVTPSGNSVLKCFFHYRHPVARTKVSRGFQCGTFLGTTNDSHYVATVSGRGVLTCIVHHG